MVPFFICVVIAQVASEKQAELEVKHAVERSRGYLEKGAETWKQERGCVSCHRVSFLIWNHHEAQLHGIKIDEARLRATTDWAFVNMLAERKEVGGVDTISQMLLGRDRRSSWREKPPRHFKTVDPYETLFEILLERQNEDGSWPPEGQLTTPPEITTAWALLALESRVDHKDDPSTGLDPKSDLGDELAGQLKTLEQRIPESRARAVKFLNGVKPHATNEARILRVMLEPILDVREGGKATLRETLISAQKPDGGWSNLLDAPESDAFATGQTLYALSQIGEPTDSPVIDRARRFLLDSQSDDGIWHVPADRVRIGKRSESLDEVFSYWGTAWASIGLLRTTSRAP